jgi:regulator of sigma E protease
LNLTLLGAAAFLPPALTYAGSFLAALAVLIFVHEFGHFVAARLLGVGVVRFSLGFGPRLFGFRRGETEYVVSAVPFGGYVKLVGESEEEEGGSPDADLSAPPDEASRLAALAEAAALEERSFNRKPVRIRMAVVAAGPLGNLVFAVLAFWLFFLGGIPALSPRLDPEPGSPAAAAGFRAGDTLLAVGGKAVRSFDEAVAALEAAPAGRPASVRVRRDGAEAEVPFSLPADRSRSGFLPWLPPRIGEVVGGTPAAKAGLAAGDDIVSVDGEPVTAWGQVSRRIRSKSEGEAVRLEVRRGAEKLSISVVPEFVPPAEGGKGKKEPRIGVVGKQEAIRLPLGPLEALGRGAAETWRLVAMTGDVVLKLVRRILPASTLGGPILIAQMAGEQAKEGILPFAYFLGLLSVNLGVLNLLPIPVLDGGHLLLFLLEAILGRPLSVRARMRAQQAGLAFILGLTVLVFYNDIVRLFHGR